MAENIKRVEKAGVAEAWYWNINSDGICLGTETTIAAGAKAVLGRVKGIKTAEFPIPDVVRTPVSGDDQLLYEFIFPALQAPSGTLSAGAEDLDFEADIQNTVVFAEGGWSMGVAFPLDLVFEGKGLLITSRAASDDDGVAVSEGYWNRIIPLATISPQGEAGVSEQSAIAANYGMVINRADRLPYGRPFTNADFGTTRAGYIKFWTENKWTMEVFAGHATPVAELALARTPAGDHATNKVMVTVFDGSTFVKKVATTDFTVDDTPGASTVDMEAGDEIAAGELAVVSYEYID
jgi:hypothetical protein